MAERCTSLYRSAQCRSAKCDFSFPTIVAGLVTVGIILVVAMLITLGATAHLLTDRFKTIMLISVGVG
ncbi:hypothetical protein RO22_12045 [Halomonas sp. KHS3]|jgi:hypothetical protein|nr:hypothetical protein RO22_12045 [Halomonas sp. KHS3]